MRLVETKDLKAGDIIGRELYSDSGGLLLGKGVILTDGLIERVMETKIYCVYIDDEISKGIEPKGIIDDITMVRSINTVKNAVESFTKTSGSSGLAGTIPLKDFTMVQGVVNELILCLEESGEALYTVTELMGTDMYTFRHSVNVTVLSIMVAKSMGYNREQIKQIALGGLLHDIGKLRVKSGIVNKPGELTDEEFIEMKRHPELGHELVKNDQVLSAISKNMILMHHEKLDGSGYPLRLKGDAVPNHVKIVALCDMYDAMTSDRCYRKRMPIYKALEILMCEAVEKIDADIYRHLVENLCIYPVGTAVTLSDGNKAIVMEYRRINPTRPIVRLVTSPYRIVDLEMELTLFIVDSK